MNGPRIRLVTRGDDAGSCESANRAILQACEEGMLRNASVMVPGPAFEEAAKLLAGRTDICLGLHVTLNAEWDGPKWGPVLPPEQVPSLVDPQGYFWSTPVLSRDRGATVDQMLAEIRAQLGKARRHGLDVAYIDEHMGISGPWPDLRAGIAELASREGLVDAHSIPGLPGAYPHGGDRVAAWSKAVAAAAPGAYVLVTHPGRDADDMRQFGMAGMAPGEVARDRDADRLAWIDPRLRQAFAANGVAVVRYTDVVSVS